MYKVKKIPSINGGYIYAVMNDGAVTAVFDTRPEAREQADWRNEFSDRALSAIAAAL